MKLEDIERSKYYNLYMTHYFLTSGPSWDLDSKRAKHAIILLDELLFNAEEIDNEFNGLIDINNVFTKFKESMAVNLFSNETEDYTLKEVSENIYSTISADIMKIIGYFLNKE